MVRQETTLGFADTWYALPSVVQSAINYYQAIINASMNASFMVGTAYNMYAYAAAEQNLEDAIIAADRSPRMVRCRVQACVG